MRSLSRIMLSLCLLFAFVSAVSAQQITAQSFRDFLNQAKASPYLGTPDGVPPSGETICQGLTGAAHGLCTAYCEAMDCDSANPQASPKACTKVAENYARITGQGTLPCDCPCVTQLPGWIEVVNGPLAQCVGGVFSEDAVILVSAQPEGLLPAAGSAPGEGGVCGFFPIIGIPITEQQGKACVNLLLQRAAAAGLNCGPI